VAQERNNNKSLGRGASAACARISPHVYDFELSLSVSVHLQAAHTLGGALALRISAPAQQHFDPPGAELMEVDTK